MSETNGSNQHNRAFSQPPVSVAILAGGRSSRMGTDKAMLPLGQGGRPLLGWVIDAVHGLSDDLAIIATDRPGYSRFGLPVIPDRFPGAAALGGIATALHHARHDACLVVSCDTPLLVPAMVRLLMQFAGDAEVVVPVVLDPDGQREWQPLCAVYAKGLLPRIEAAIALGQLRITDLFPGSKIVPISGDLLRAVDPDLRSFHNVNDPTELAMVQNLIASGRGR